LLLITTDNGDTWTKLDYPAFCTSSPNSIYGVFPHPTDPNIIYVSDVNGFIRSTDGGATWKGSMEGGFPCYGGPSTYAAAVNGDVIYAAGDGVLRSDNGGNTWHNKSTGLPIEDVSARSPVIHVIVDPRSAAVAFALTADGRVYKTSTSGEQWNLISAGLGDATIEAFFLQPAHNNTLYAASVTQLYALPDGATTWQQIETPARPDSSSHPDLRGVLVVPQLADRYIVYNDSGIQVILQTPTLSSITPQNVRAGSSAFVLTVRGTSFTPAARIYWNGIAQPTTYIDETQLTTTISASDVLISKEVPIFIGYPSIYEGGSAQAMSDTKLFTVLTASGQEPSLQYIPLAQR
jgi:photosystem II stability/assembly factor-like uncharacterized protein